MIRSPVSATGGRRLKKQENLGPTEAIFDGRRATVFSGNDYLGLSHHPLVKEAAAQALADFGNSAGASRLISGNHLYSEVESNLASLKKKEAALVFSTGFMANLGTLTTLSEPKDTIYIDKLCHASLYDGCRLSGATIKRYPHNNLAKLEQLLNSHTAGRSIIVTDGVFSMDGDCAPLADIKQLAVEYGSLLIVDDAHGTGVLGPRGGGTSALQGVDLDMEVGTLSKALGSLGGFVVGSKRLIDALVDRARPFIYTTGLPPAILAGANAAISIIKSQNRQQERVLFLAERARTRLTAAGWQIPPGITPIIPLIIGDAQKAHALSATLLAKGIFIPAIKSPTVPARKARLRMTVSAAHSDKEFNHALDAIIAGGKELKII